MWQKERLDGEKIHVPVLRLLGLAFSWPFARLVGTSLVSERLRGVPISEIRTDALEHARAMDVLATRTARLRTAWV